MWIRIRIRVSMHLTNGPGSRFGCGSGSCYFVIDLQDTNKKLIFKKKCFCLLLYEGTFTSFFKDKKTKRSYKTVGIKVFSYLFGLMIEESGSGSRSGSIPLTSKSGSERPKNMWVRWFRIRIRIRNTASYNNRTQHF
jgi:hypothetical protein